jgi:hypothetical protein
MRLWQSLVCCITGNDLADGLLEALKCRVYVGVSAGSMIFSRNLTEHSADVIGDAGDLHVLGATEDWCEQQRRILSGRALSDSMAGRRVPRGCVEGRGRSTTGGTQAASCDCSGGASQSWTRW